MTATVVASPRVKSRTLAVRALVAAIAVTLIVVALHRMGGGPSFLAVLRAATTWLPLLFAIEGARIACDLFALRSLLGKDAHALSWRTWVRVHLVAQAAIVVLPAGRAVSEGLKIARLGRTFGNARATAVVATLHVTTLLTIGAVAIGGALTAAWAHAPVLALAFAIHGGICLFGAIGLRLALYRARVPKAVTRWLRGATSAVEARGDASEGALREEARAMPWMPVPALAIKALNRGLQVAQLAILLFVIGAPATIGSSLLAASSSLFGGAIDVSIASIGQTDAAVAGVSSLLQTSIASALGLVAVARAVQLSWSAIGGVMFALPESKADTMTAPRAKETQVVPALHADKREQVGMGHALRSAARVLESRILGNHRPLFVNIEPTHRCNLECSYCDKTGPGAPQMTTEEGVRLVEELADAGTLSVCFDGGDPLVHPGIGAMIRAARNRGLMVSLSTNGILVPRKIEDVALVQFVKISIDGPEAIHDAARGAGSFRQALVGARAAKARGVAVAIRMTIAEHNVKAHRAVLAIAKELGVSAIFQPAIGSLFDATNHQAEHSPHIEAYRETIDDLIDLKRRGALIANELVALRHLREWPNPKPVPFCAGGRVMAAIGPEGGVYPCGRVGREERAPNALERGVVAAFSDVQRPTDCASCWCSLTVANNYAYRLDPRLLEGRLYHVPVEDPSLQLLTEEMPKEMMPPASSLVQLRRKGAYPLPESVTRRPG